MPLSLLLSPTMSRFHWDSKDVTTSRRELWYFYLYSIVRVSLFFFTLSFPFSIIDHGNDGLAGFRFGPSQIQNLLYFAGYDMSQPPFAKLCGSGSNCVLPFIKSFMGHVRNSPSFSHRSHLRCSSMGSFLFIFLCVVNFSGLCDVDVRKSQGGRMETDCSKTGQISCFFFTI
jgi:hypothetical protein